MQSASQRGKREVAIHRQLIRMLLAFLGNEGFGSYTATANCPPSMLVATPTQTTSDSKPTGSPTSGRGGKAKAGRGTPSGSQPGKQPHGGVDRG